MTCNNYRSNTTAKICTSHGFSYEKLEEMVVKIIKDLFLDIDNKKIELSIKNSKTTNDYTKMLKKLEKEIDIINNNIDKMYIDKLNNEISKEMYDRVCKKFNEEIKEKKETYMELKEEELNSKEDNNQNIEKVVKEFLKLEKPTPELMRVIINKILIHQDKQVDIIFNFKKLNYFLNNDYLL